MCNELNKSVRLCVYTLAKRAGLCIVSTLWRHVQVCVLCLHSGDTCVSVYCVYALATLAGFFIVSTLWRHVQVCVLCLHSGDKCVSVYCVYTLATRACLSIVSTLWQHVLICVLCLHSGDTCWSVYCVYTVDSDKNVRCVLQHGAWHVYLCCVIEARTQDFSLKGLTLRLYVIYIWFWKLCYKNYVVSTT
jgi:hypothetical protein